MAMDRNELKARLRNRRYRCDVCGGHLALGVDMHESIVRRGQAQGWPKARREAIFVEENSHLVHHGDCHTEAHANPRLMVAIQIVRYGKDRIQAWIDSLPFKVKYHWDRGLTEASARYVVEVFAPWTLEE